MEHRAPLQVPSQLPDREAKFRADLIQLLPTLRAFAKLIARNVAEADDLVQGTVLRALTAQHSFELGTNMRSWLFCILRNLHISEIRNRKIRVNVPIDDAPEAYLQSPETQLRAKQIKDDQREALVLVAMAGCSYEEAAKICGCAVGTIKSRVNRAKAAVLTILNPASVPAMGPPMTISAEAGAQTERR